VREGHAAADRRDRCLCASERLDERRSAFAVSAMVRKDSQTDPGAQLSLSQADQEGVVVLRHNILHYLRPAFKVFTCDAIQPPFG